MRYFTVRCTLRVCLCSGGAAEVMPDVGGFFCHDPLDQAPWRSHASDLIRRKAVRALVPKSSLTWRGSDQGLGAVEETARARNDKRAEMVGSAATTWHTMSGKAGLSIRGGALVSEFKLRTDNSSRICIGFATHTMGMILCFMCSSVSCIKLRNRI